MAEVVPSVRLKCCALLSLTLICGIARAEEHAGDSHEIGRAEALFVAGKRRLANNDIAAACSLLAQSYLLDPATGSLLALALCHERQGKLASALREYEQAVDRSRREQRGDREAAAVQQMARLKGRVSTLRLRPEEPGLDLVVRVNGELVPPEQIGRPQPMDGGFVLVEAEAEGKINWRTGVTIADSGEALTVAIPLMRTASLRPAPVAEPAPPAPAPADAAPPPSKPRATGREARPEPKFSTLQRTGIAFMCTGAVGAGLAVGFTLRAVQKDKDSDSGCLDDLCTSSARRDRLDARAAGNIATIATVAATAFATAGLTAYLLGVKRKRDQRALDSVRLRTSAWFDARGAGAVLTGGF